MLYFMHSKRLLTRSKELLRCFEILRKQNLNQKAQSVIAPVSRQKKSTPKNIKLSKSSKIKEKLLTAEETSGTSLQPIIFHRPSSKIIDSEKNSQGTSGKDATSLSTDIEKLLELYKDNEFKREREDSSKPPSTAMGELPTKEPKKTVLIDAIPPKELQWTEQTVELQQLPKVYMKLSKIRLTGLVVLTTIGGYAMAPAYFDPLILLMTAVGTGLTSCSANTINQFFEVPFDSQMNRTKNRVLVRHLITPLHAACFAAASGLTGLTILTLGVNGLTAALGATNLVLYTLIYTPMKRYSIANTWVGSIVGAIPPIMGWTACTGSLDIGALLLAAVLYAWQFPHFNALSWNLRGDYSRAGYRMMSVTSPELCKRTTLRYTIMLLGLCTSAPLAGVTTWSFAIDSAPVNLYMIYLAWQFYSNADSASSRKLFRASLLYLPLIMMLMLISKKKPDASNAGSNNKLMPLKEQL